MLARSTAVVTILLLLIFALHETVFNFTKTFFLPRPSNASDIALYYRHATSARNSSYPLISGDTFRAMADFVFDETRQDDLQKVRHGDVVFVKADMLSRFFSSPFDSIRHPFVLVSHNSDHSAPAAHQSYLSSEKILQWFASNPSLRATKKLSPIPIGLANTRWSHGKLDRLTNAFLRFRKPWSNRTTLLYVNFDVGTNRVERERALKQALKFDSEHVQIIKQKIAPDTYLEQLGSAKFVLSPPGNGLDCHRTWEAMLMGAAPIVLSSGLDPLFTNTRSVILDDWSKLTLDFLLRLTFPSDDQRLSDPLSARYWRERLLGRVDLLH